MGIVHGKRSARHVGLSKWEAVPFPSVFKEGWLRLDKKFPFLSGADGREARAR